MSNIVYQNDKYQVEVMAHTFYDHGSPTETRDVYKLRNKQTGVIEYMDTILVNITDMANNLEQAVLKMEQEQDRRAAGKQDFNIPSDFGNDVGSEFNSVDD